MRTYYIFYTILTSILVSACGETIIEIVPEPAEKSITVIGEISPQHGITVKAMESLPTAGFVDLNELALNDPSIFLNKNQEEIKLLSSSKLLFENHAYKEIYAQDTFQLFVKDEGLSSVNSSLVVIPRKPKIDAIDLYETGDFTINGLPIWQVKIDVQHQEDIAYYGADIFIVDKEGGKRVLEKKLERWPVGALSDICSIDTELYFDAACIPNQNFSLVFNVQMEDFYFRDRDITNRIEFDSIEVELSALDENWFEFRQTRQSPFDEQFLSEPNITYSNIVNGYGVFYAYNSALIRFQVR